MIQRMRVKLNSSCFRFSFYPLSFSFHSNSFSFFPSLLFLSLSCLILIQFQVEGSLSTQKQEQLDRCNSFIFISFPLLLIRVSFPPPCFHPFSLSYPSILGKRKRQKNGKKKKDKQNISERERERGKKQKATACDETSFIFFPSSLFSHHFLHLLSLSSCLRIQLFLSLSLSPSLSVQSSFMLKHSILPSSKHCPPLPLL